eukprot:817115-Pleurochrysis_carterae.AAC.1
MPSSGRAGDATSFHSTENNCSDPIPANALDANSLGANSLGANSLGANSLGPNSLGANSLGANSLGASSLGAHERGTNARGSVSGIVSPFAASTQIACGDSLSAKGMRQNLELASCIPGEANETADASAQV